VKYDEAFKRAFATFVFGALSAPATAAWFDTATWKMATASGVAALINLAFRWSQAYLSSFPEEG
jgi:hypothetical protein